MQRDYLPVDKWSEGFVVKFSEDDKILQFLLHPREEWRPPLPDDGVNYVAHMLPGDKRAKERWFIPITDMWRKRRFLGRLENALVEGQDGWVPIRRRHRRSMGILVNVRVEGQDGKLPMRRRRRLSE